MSKKIYGIVALLIIIAAIITGLGMYSIDRLGDSLESLSRLANRSINYNKLSEIQLRRRINLMLLMSESTEEGKRGPARRAGKGV